MMAKLWGLVALPLLKVRVAMATLKAICNVLGFADLIQLDLVTLGTGPHSVNGSMALVLRAADHLAT